MKKKNSVCEFSTHRNRFILQSFRDALARQSEIDKEKAFKTVARTPSPRFWVSETRAAEIVGKLLAGADPTARMFPERKEMFIEIFNRFLELRKKNPDASIAQLTLEIVNDSAPRPYLSWETIRSIVYRTQKLLREERRRKLCR